MQKLPIFRKFPLVVVVEKRMNECPVVVAPRSKLEKKMLTVAAAAVENHKLLSNVHKVFENSNYYRVSFVKGTYEYYHYLCDGFDDRGWGCGYRTLQTICSWVKLNYNDEIKITSIEAIQNVLVDIEDKPKSFYRSRQWIGSFEVCLVLYHFYGIQSKILHVNNGDALTSIIETIWTHFEKFGSPIMMGGDIDCSSKGIMGINIDSNGKAELLVVDPHYVGEEKTAEFLKNKGWVKWQPVEDFLSSSFYNLCLPQVRCKTIDLVSK